MLGIEKQYADEKLIVYDKEKSSIGGQLEKEGLGVFPSKKKLQPIVIASPQIAEEDGSSNNLRLDSSDGF